MCKICTTCESIMNYDPYFEAEVCVKCGNFGGNGSSLSKKFSI